MKKDTAKRKKPTPNIEAQIMFKSDRKCCICRNPGAQIHHIDGNSANSVIENLALLCFDCHHEASIIGGNRKKLSPKTILLYRDNHYKEVERKRQSVRVVKKVALPIKGLTSEDILDATKNAIIIVELAKIKEEYYNAGSWQERKKAIEKLYKYSDYSNARLALEVYPFLSTVADAARSRMSFKFAFTLESIVISFLSYSFEKENKETVYQIGKQVCQIAFAIGYDSIIYLDNIAVLVSGLQILKYVYTYAKDTKNSKLILEVLKVYEELEQNSNRCEVNTRDDVKEIIGVFKLDLDKRGLIYPLIPRKAYQRFEMDKLKDN